MKPIRFILAAAFALCLLVVVRAAQLTVNIGTSANDGTGDTLRMPIALLIGLAAPTAIPVALTAFSAWIGKRGDAA